MKKILLLTLACAVAVLSGCQTRSISDSGYESERGNRYGSNRGGGFYQGELSEFDVLGIERGAKPSDAEITAVLAARKPILLKRGASVMLIQSGALIPDAGMTTAMSKNFSVGVFSGQPSAQNTISTTTVSAESYSRSLRLAAARGGHETLVVYWGLLESARENLATSSVSWVPVVGWLLPDEKQRMRIRLKVAMIDVATGNWEMYSPEPQDDRGLSSILSRKDTDQTLVNSLKEKAYALTADDLAKRFLR